MTESEYPIYDTLGENTPLSVYETEEDQSVVTQSQFIPPSKMSDMPKLPIFSNFPMMKPHEFINLISESEDGVLPGNFLILASNYFLHFFRFQRRHSEG